MKKIFLAFILFSLMIIPMNNFAGGVSIKEKLNQETDIAQKSTEKKLNNQSGFIENKGQMKNREGEAVPEVLFKTEAPGVNLWITEKGIVIETREWEKIPIAEDKLTESEREDQIARGRKKTTKNLHWERIDIELSGASIDKAKIIKENPYPGHINYFYAHCPEGIYDVKEYGKITIQDVYPGIDWVFFRQSDGLLKHEFVVHPGADYKQIELIYRSKDPVIIDETGQLIMTTRHGNLKENTPVSFYKNEEILTSFVMKKSGVADFMGETCYETIIKFNCQLSESYNKGATSKLTIDPDMVWSTFKGGNDHNGPMAITSDANGNIFIVGYTYDGGFPTTDPGNGAYFEGTFQGGTQDAFIWKFNNNGEIIWSTFYGGSGVETFHSCTVDEVGDLFVVGQTYSTNFPTQDPGGGAYYESTGSVAGKGAILKFSNSGVRKWATYYQGALCYSVCYDNDGSILITGRALNGMPTYDPGGGAYFNGSKAGTYAAMILKFDTLGVRQWATYYGGLASANDYGYGITVDGLGNIFVTGQTFSSDFNTLDAGTYYDNTRGGSSDAFILKFDKSLDLKWATLYGGAGNTDIGYSVITDSNNNVYVAGITNSADMETQDPGGGAYYLFSRPGNQAVFLLKFDNLGNRIWATYFGGGFWERMETWSNNLTVNSCDNIALTFNTNSTDVATMEGCDLGYTDFTHNGGGNDQYICVFNSIGQMIYGSYFGGNGDDFRSSIVFVDDNLFFTGEWTAVTDESTYPLENPGGGAYYDDTFNGVDDGFVIRLNFGNCFCNTLPIELLDFYGINTGDENIIHWTTMSETNCDYFELERALELNDTYTDQLLWETIGQINGAGNSSFKMNYEYIDADYPKNLTVVYYRLKQVDFDGSTDYYGPVTINLKNETSLFEVYPNPASDELMVYLKNDCTGKIAISIVNLLGRVVFQKTENIDKNQSNISLDIGHLAEGVYFIKLSIDGVVAGTKKISITK